MRTSSAAQTPVTPQSSCEGERRKDDEDGARGEHRPHEIARVSGADEDPVEREDGAAERLHHDEERPEERGLVEYGLVVGERGREGVGERREDQREDAADRDRPADHPQRGVVGAVRVPGAEHPPDDHLARDRDRVEDERDEEEELIARSGARRSRRRPSARAPTRRRGTRVERGGADEDLPADAHHRPHLPPARATRRRVRTQQLDDEGDAHSRLRDRRPGGGAGDAPVEDVDEEDLEHEVRDVRDDDDLERPAEVRDAAQVALPRERDKRGR